MASRTWATTNVLPHQTKSSPDSYNGQRNQEYWTHAHRLWIQAVERGSAPVLQCPGQEKFALDKVMRARYRETKALLLPMRGRPPGSRSAFKLLFLYNTGVPLALGQLCTANRTLKAAFPSWNACS